MRRLFERVLTCLMVPVVLPLYFADHDTIHAIRHNRHRCLRNPCPWHPDIEEEETL